VRALAQSYGVWHLHSPAWVRRRLQAGARACPCWLCQRV